MLLVQEYQGSGFTNLQVCMAQLPLSHLKQCVETEHPKRLFHPRSAVTGNLVDTLDTASFVAHCILIIYSQNHVLQIMVVSVVVVCCFIQKHSIAVPGRKNNKFYSELNDLVCK